MTARILRCALGSRQKVINAATIRLKNSALGKIEEGETKRY
jgi:hypothetical protein